MAMYTGTNEGKVVNIDGNGIGKMLTSGGSGVSVDPGLISVGSSL